jgi:hypothetical protein
MLEVIILEGQIKLQLQMGTSILMEARSADFLSCSPDRDHGNSENGVCIVHKQMINESKLLWLEFASAGTGCSPSSLDLCHSSQSVESVGTKLQIKWSNFLRLACFHFAYLGGPTTQIIQVSPERHACK